MSHAGVIQNSFRTPSELIQKALGVIQDSFRIHSEFVQTYSRGGKLLISGQDATSCLGGPKGGPGSHLLWILEGF